MKLWVDSKTPAPGAHGNQYYWKKSVDDVIGTIQHSDFHIERLMRNGHERFLERDYVGRTKCYEHANKWDITEINMSQEFAESVDGKKLLMYIEELGRTEIYNIRFH
jgi:hypothetical protein